MIDDVEVTGIFITDEGPVAQVRVADRRQSYLLHEGDQLYDGDVTSIAFDEVVFKTNLDRSFGNQAVPSGRQEAQAAGRRGLLARSCREASAMGDLVNMKKATGWKVSIGIGLLLAPAFAGALLGADDATQQTVVTETVEAAAYEPVAEAEIGTADNPYNGPVPEGVAASQLVSVSTETFGDTALVEIFGDGSFEYAAFQLSDPARFVLDLPGVVKTTEQVSLSVDHDIVSHIRVGQYRADPEPVSRVVFDLAVPAVPRIEPMPEGLAVSFDAESLAAVFPSAVELPAIAQTAEPALSEIAEAVVEEVTEPVEIAEATTVTPRGAGRRGDARTRRRGDGRRGMGRAGRGRERPRGSRLPRQKSSRSRRPR